MHPGAVAGQVIKTRLVSYAVAVVVAKPAKKLFTLLDLCVSSLRRGHANLLCIVPILTDDPRRESKRLEQHT
jgi:hypothetical protein